MLALHFPALAAFGQSDGTWTQPAPATLLPASASQQGDTCHSYGLIPNSATGAANAKIYNGTHIYHYETDSCECEAICDAADECVGFVDFFEAKHCRFKTTTDVKSSSSSRKNLYVKQRDDSFSVHGDPMFKSHNGTAVHFWITEGVLTPLLVWTSAENQTFELSGRTFARKATGNQWFKQLVFAQNGEKVIDVTAVANGMKVRKTPRTGVASDAAHVTTQGDQLVMVEANGVHFEVKPAGAAKFASKALRAEYTHLNVAFPSGIPAGVGATGIFAQLAGNEPMLVATQELLKRPHGGRARRGRAAPRATA